MLDKLQAIRDRHDELTTLLSDPEVLSDHNLVRKYSKERAGMDDIVVAADEYERILTDITSANEIIEGSTDPDEKEFAKGELDELQPQLDALEERLKVLLVPKDPNDDKNVIVEIRAGTGGEEAALFAATSSGCTRATPRARSGASTS
jgi:peptide chain release factor 1